MFIKEAEYENFLNFYTGMGIYYIHFDFSNGRNPIYVIIGPNGIGKTSLLSYLTPFASIGTLDVRESNKLIIPGKDGYKRIVFLDEFLNEFEIEHFYAYSKSKDSYSVKSYIKENGVELNENGNVTTFKELVYEYLDVDISFLKLIRIGSNVANLIKAKPTERKTFMGKILEDVDWYLKRYKYVSQKERDLKVLMTHTIDQLTKTNVTDVDESKKKIKDLEYYLSTIEDKITKAVEAKSAYEYQIGELQLPENYMQEANKKKKHVQKLEYALSLNQQSKLTLEQVNKEITTSNENLASLNQTISSIKATMDDTLQRMDRCQKDIDSIISSIEKEEKSLNIHSLEEFLKDRRKTMNFMYRKAYDEIPIICTKDEFEEFYVFLKNIQQRLNTAYEYGKGPIREVIKLMMKNEDIPQIITASLIAIESQENRERMALIDRMIDRYVGLSISCKDECPLKALQKELQDIKDAKPVNMIKYTSEFYQMMRLAYDSISSVFQDLSRQKEIIQKLPTDIQAMFTINNLSEHIKNTEFIYDDKVLNDLLSFLTERQNYRDLEKEVNDLERELREKKKDSRVDFLNEELDKAKDQMDELKNSQSELSQELEKQISCLVYNQENQKHLLELEEALANYEKEESEYNDLCVRIEKAENLSREINLLKDQLESLNELKDRTINELYQTKANIVRYKNLTTDLSAQKSLYEEYNNLKFGLSNSTGVPIALIEDYLKETVGIANQIIDIAYNGKLKLRKFEINESTFMMPYEKNGKIVDDVISASQGEESFFNLAISSALRSQSMTRFNIGLFDEVDSVFDDDNRQHFIPVMEKTLELNNINQAFLITHNLMFRQYPVNRIDLGNLDNSSIKIEYR